MTGGLTSSVVSIMQAAPWHAAGITGPASELGSSTSSTGTNGPPSRTPVRYPWRAARSAGTVKRPAPCGIQEDGHGNAVAETIYDLAPGVSFYLATPGTISDYYAAMDWFAANGVRIVNRSLGSPYDGPGDGTDRSTRSSTTPPCAADDLQLAGNEGSAQYWRGTWVDANGNGYLDFAPGDETLDVTGACVSSLGVRWNDWGPPSTRTNYDAQILSGPAMVWPRVASAPTSRPEHLRSSSRASRTRAAVGPTRSSSRSRQRRRHERRHRSSCTRATRSTGSRHSRRWPDRRQPQPRRRRRRRHRPCCGGNHQAVLLPQVRRTTAGSSLMSSPPPASRARSTSPTTPASTARASAPAAAAIGALVLGANLATEPVAVAALREAPRGRPRRSRPRPGVRQR